MEPVVVTSTLESTQVSAHQIFLTARRITNIVNSLRFRLAWKEAPLDERNKINEYVLAQNEHEIMLWFDRYAPLLSYKAILVLAKKHRMLNYSRVTKNEMLSYLIQEGIIKESQL